MKIRRTIVYLLIAFHIVFFSADYLLADTVSLEDGTVLVGKVIKNDSSEIVFKNSYGVFTLREELICRLYVTDSYNEDIEINRELGQRFDEEEIKRDYLAGTEGLNYKFAAKSMPKRISIFGTSMSAMGKYSDVIPYGFGFFASYEQSLDSMIDSKFYFWMPGIRLEAGYMLYEKDLTKLAVTPLSAGPVWLLPFVKNRWGNVIVSLLFGVSLMKVTNDNTGYNSNTSTFTMQSIIGYEYSFGRTVVFIHARYMHIYDANISLNSFGGEFGVGYRLW